MNLSQYESLDPNVDRSNRQTCLTTCGNALPSHHSAPILLLGPGAGPLGLAPRHDLFEGSPTRLLGLPDALGELCPSPTLAQWWAERLGSGACGRRHALEALTRTPAVTRADCDRVK